MLDEMFARVDGVMSESNNTESGVKDQNVPDVQMEDETPQDENPQEDDVTEIDSEPERLTMQSARDASPERTREQQAKSSSRSRSRSPPTKRKANASAAAMSNGADFKRSTGAKPAKKPPLRQAYRQTYRDSDSEDSSWSIRSRSQSRSRSRSPEPRVASGTKRGSRRPTKSKQGKQAKESKQGKTKRNDWGPIPETEPPTLREQKGMHQWVHERTAHPSDYTEAAGDRNLLQIFTVRDIFSGMCVGIPCPIFDGQWGNPSPDDDWCFMRDSGFTAENQKGNDDYDKLMHFASFYGTEDTFRVCRLIEKHYNDKFRAFVERDMGPDPETNEPCDRPWTLLSIRAWLENSPSKAAMLNMATKVVFKKIMNMAESELATMDPLTGGKKDCGFADSRFKDMVKTLTQLVKAKS